MKKTLQSNVVSCLLGIAMTACVSSSFKNLSVPTSDGSRHLRSIASQMSQRKFRSQGDRELYVTAFEVFFMRALQTGMYSSSTYFPPNDPYRVGAEDGIALAKQKNERPKDFPLLDIVHFGYIMTNVTGEIFLASETAMITLNNGERWWIENEGILSNVVWETKRYGSGSQDVEWTSKKKVTIEGYVSPFGQYGHMGNWERGIIVTGQR